MVYWREIPLVRLFLPFLFGIYLSEAIPFYQRELLWILPFFLASLYWLSIAQLDFGERWKSGLFSSLFFFLFAYLLTAHYDERRTSNYFTHFLEKETVLIGQVANYPHGNDAFIKIKLRVQHVQKEDDLLDCTGNVLVYLKQATTNKQSVHYGDKIILKGAINPVPPPKNPDAFDYRNYLHYQNIHHQGFIDTSHWSIVAKGQAPLLLQKAYYWQSHFLQVLQTYLTTPTTFAIASAMTLGHKDAMTDTIKNAYSESGAIHVLAVSGLHVGILSEVVLLILGLFSFRSPYWPWTKYVLSLFVIWCFALLVGATDSVLRAALMFSFLNFGRVLRRDIHPFNSLAGAAFFILIVNPYALFQIGFQFSFLAVVGIFFFYKNIYACWSPAAKLLNFFWQLTVVGISAQLMVAPLVVYYFHQFPIYSLLTGLFVVPFATGILYLSVSLLAVHTFSTTLAAYLGTCLFYLIDTQNKLIFFIQQLPFHLQEGIWLQPYELAFLYLAVFALLLMFLTKRLVWIQGIAACLCILLGTNIYKKTMSVQQQKVVVYDISKETVIDFIAGTSVYTWSSDSIALKKINYATQNHRWAVGMQHQYAINKEGAVFEAASLFRQANYLQFDDYRMVLIDKKTKLANKPPKPLYCQALLLIDSPTIAIKDLSKNYNFELLLFDQSNSRKLVNKWKVTCKKEGIPYYDIGEQGAYVVDF